MQLRDGSSGDTRFRRDHEGRGPLRELVSPQEGEGMGALAPSVVRMLAAGRLQARVTDGTQPGRQAHVGPPASSTGENKCLCFKPPV